MADITSPIALDESFNTTETTPRNIADVVADETGDLVTQATAIVTKLQALINAVKPNASDIPLDPITGMSANNVQDGVSELKGTLNKLDGSIIIASGHSLYEFIRNTSNPSGFYMVNIQRATDNPRSGITGLAYVFKPLTNGDYTVCMVFQSGSMHISTQLSPSATAITWNSVAFQS